MFKYVDNFRLSFMDSVSYQLAVGRKRSRDLNLSKMVDVEACHSAGINSIEVDCINGTYLLSGCSDGKIFVHNTQNYTGSPHYSCKLICLFNDASSLGEKYSVETVQWYPYDTGMFLSSGMDKTLKIWDTSELKPAEQMPFKGRIFQHHLSPILSETRTLVAVASSINQVILGDLRSGQSTHELRGHTSSVTTCKWSPRNSHLLATGSADYRLILWDVRSTNRVLKTLDMNNVKGVRRYTKKFFAHDGAVNGINFTRNGLFLISFGADNCLRLWDVSTGVNEGINFGNIANITQKAVQFDVSAFSREDLVYIPSEGNIYVYSLFTGELVKTLTGHYNAVNCCYFDPFNIQLFSGGSDRNILLWADEENVSDSLDNKHTNVDQDDWSD